MRRISLIALVPLLAGSLISCEQSTGSAPDPAGGSTGFARPELAPAEKALAAVGTAPAHQAMEHGRGRVIYHPGWSSRIAVDEAGAHTEIYRQTRRYYGPYPREVVLGFRDVALGVFDPNHRIRGITVETLDGQVWSLEEEGLRCPPNCPPEGTDPQPTPSLAPAAAPLDPARLALAPSERARASLSTGPQHRVAETAGERATYHPGWTSRIRATDALGRTREIFRQTQVYHGARPSEAALGFRDVGLAVFDPNHRINGVTVETLDGEQWAFDRDPALCPPVCSDEDTPRSP